MSICACGSDYVCICGLNTTTEVERWQSYAGHLKNENKHLKEVRDLAHARIEQLEKQIKELRKERNKWKTQSN